MKPPFIQPTSILDFSLKYVTLLPLILTAPNLAVGLTAVKVTRALFFHEIFLNSFKLIFATLSPISHHKILIYIKVFF